MELRLLGPVELSVAGKVREVGPRQQRHTLAALAVDAGRPVTVETLIDRVWDEAPPGGARRALQAYITRIRRLLEHNDADGGPPATLARRSGGYVLDLDTQRVDLHRFQSLALSVRTPAGAGARPQEALRTAMALWRGEPLAGLTGQWAQRCRQAWRRQFFDVTVAWAQAETAAGLPDAAIATLADLTDEYPLAESVVVALMRALCAAGRSAEALEQYAVTRRRLADELGADPGAGLQAVHQAILRGELNPSTALTIPARTPPAGPTQLPADVSGFTGRNEHLARLDALLETAPGRVPTAVVICTISGPGGVGKSALAVHWAHTVRDRFPDGQLYVNLRGFDSAARPTDPAEAIRGFLDALGVSPDGIPPTLDAQVARYRSELADKRILIVLDNAHDAAQVRPLLPGTSTVVVLVTSRDQLAPLVALDGAYPMAVDVMSSAEAYDLFVRRVGRDRTAADPDATEAIIDACARLPLALAIAAARAQQSHQPLAALAADLSGTGQLLDALDAGDPDSRVRTVFSWSYAALHPPAARLFRLLGLHPGPDISEPAAAALAAGTAREVRPLLIELTRVNLLVEHASGRYSSHDLLRLYAADLTGTVDCDADREAARRRLLDHYAHSAYACAVIVQPGNDPIVLPLSPAAAGVRPERPVDSRQATAWLNAERPALLAVQRHACAAGSPAAAWQLAWCLDRYLHRQGRRQDLAAAWTVALTAAGHLADPAALAFAHRHLGFAELALGNHTQAESHFQHALHLYDETGDQTNRARTLQSLGFHWSRRGEPARALGYARRALLIHQASNHERGLAHALNAVGWYQAQLGEYRGALSACGQALTLFESIGDRPGQAATWDSLGYAHQELSNVPQAVDCYRRALLLYRDLDDHYNEAETLTRLGDTYLRAGDRAAARAAWTNAIRIHADHADSQAVRDRLDGLESVPGGATADPRLE